MHTQSSFLYDKLVIRINWIYFAISDNYKQCFLNCDWYNNSSMEALMT